MDAIFRVAPRALLPLLVAALLLPTLVRTPAPAFATSANPAAASLGDEFLTLVNRERTEAGLPALARTADVNEVAVARALDMASNGYFAHVNAAGIGAEQLLDERGVVRGLLGENIARTLASSSYAPDHVMKLLHDALMASEHHRENVLDPRFRKVGIGIADVDGRYYVAQVFTD